MTLLTLKRESQLTQQAEPEKTLGKIQSSPSVCGCCQFYKFQGRGSGYCQKLGVSVCSRWCSCSLALPPFAPSWECRENGYSQWQSQAIL